MNGAFQLQSDFSFFISLNLLPSGQLKASIVNINSFLLNQLSLSRGVLSDTAATNHI